MSRQGPTPNIKSRRKGFHKPKLWAVVSGEGIAVCNAFLSAARVAGRPHLGGTLRNLCTTNSWLQPLVNLGDICARSVLFSGVVKISELVLVTVGAANPRFPKAQSTERFSALLPDDLMIAEYDAVPFSAPPSKGRCVGVRRLRPEWPYCALRQYGVDMAWVASYAKATCSVASRSPINVGDIHQLFAGGGVGVSEVVARLDEFRGHGLRARILKFLVLSSKRPRPPRGQAAGRCPNNHLPQGTCARLL